MMLPTRGLPASVGPSNSRAGMAWPPGDVTSPPRPCRVQGLFGGSLRLANDSNAAMKVTRGAVNVRATGMGGPRTLEPESRGGSVGT